MKAKRIAHWILPIMLASAPMLGACGHTDEEMAAKQREIDKLAADLRAAKSQMASDQEAYKKAQAELEQLNEKLKAESRDMRQALDEYRKRSEQLAVIEQRFRDLKARLDRLTQIGLKVLVRNNRMVIQLPGDILFDSGKDELKPQGKEVLGQVAEVIRNDKDLNNRNFQVAGHTDNEPYGAGPFKDNWGLSLARARQVLLFLITPPKAGAKAAGGGGLNADRWAAAGYGEHDPQEGTTKEQSKEQRQKNRRVELVVQPNVEEMLNLNAIK